MNTKIASLISVLILSLICGQACATQMPEEVISTGTDDGYEDRIEPRTCYESEDWVCMSFPYDCEHGFFRFTSIPITQGATIDACTMFVDIESTLHDSPWVNIYCEDTASATTLSGELNCISSRTKTTAYATWNESNIGAGVKPTPELKSVLQEVINRPDWSSGNDVAFIFQSSSDKQFYVDTYEEGHPAYLHVWYTAAEEEEEVVMRVPEDQFFKTSFFPWEFQDVEVTEYRIVKIYGETAGQITKIYENGEVLQIYGEKNKRLTQDNWKLK